MVETAYLEMNSLIAPSSTCSGREWVRDCPENFSHNPSMKDFRNLKVWEKAHQLALALYPVTALFPRQEAYGLASQIRGVHDAWNRRHRRKSNRKVEISEISFRSSGF